jgi:hypothetical protein
MENYPIVGPVFHKYRYYNLFCRSAEASVSWNSEGNFSQIYIFVADFDAARVPYRFTYKLKAGNAGFPFSACSRHCPYLVTQMPSLSEAASAAIGKESGLPSVTLRAARRSDRFFAAKEPDMKRELIDEAVRAAARMAADRGIDLDQSALIPAVCAVIATSNGQDDPEAIAEDALELMGSGLGAPASRRGRRPF